MPAPCKWVFNETERYDLVISFIGGKYYNGTSKSMYERNNGLMTREIKYDKALM